MKISHRYNRPTPGGLNFANAIGRTRQEFKDECDINVLIARHQPGTPIQAPWSKPPTPMFGDFAEAPDYLEAQLVLLKAREQFASLPAKVRARFANDPAELLAFVHDPKNTDEARDLGLLNPAAPQPPPATPAATP